MSSSNDNLYDPYNFKNKPISCQDIQKILAKYGIIGYKVSDLEVFQTAFVHTSYHRKNEYTNLLGEPAILVPCPNGCMDLQNGNYQRLEFLGDAIIDKVIARYLFERYPDADEDFLTRVKSRLVKNEHISVLSAKLGLPQFFVISKHVEEITHGRDNPKKQSDIFEAFIGALELDSGDSAMVETFLINVFERHVDFAMVIYKNDNYKDTFQQHCQGVLGFTPIYVQQCAEGTGSNKIYTMAVSSPEGVVYGVGQSSKKKDAEQLACKQALESLKLNPMKR